MGIAISGAELDIMKRLWEHPDENTFSSLLEWANQTAQKNWSKQTLNTHLKRLQNKTLIYKEKIGTKIIYQSRMTREEHQQACVQEVLDTAYGGLLSNFIFALTGNKRISPDKVKELEKLIRDAK